MGCDIHQINIMIDTATKKPYDFSGEVPIRAKYKSGYVEEFIPGRSYDLFAILAGVRGDMFQITDNVYSGIPEELPEDLKKDIEDKEYCCHSFTWYFMEDLQKELEWTAEKIQMYLQARANQDPEFIADGEIDEWRSIKGSVQRWIKILAETKDKLRSEGHAGDFKTSKIFFFFDS